MADQPNIMFKRGLQANLPGANNATDGTFYLTTDTQRLYVGIDSKLAELNKTIRSVNSIAALQALRGPVGNNANDGVAEGDFYYVKTGASSTSGNILAYCSGVASDGTPTWVQINPDTDTTINSSTNAVSVSSVAASGTDAAGASISMSVTDGEHTASGSAKILGSKNITVERDSNGNIVISTGDAVNTTYELKTTTNANKGVIFLDSTGTDSSIDIVGGNDVTVKSTTVGKIDIDVADMRTSEVAITAENEGFSIQTTAGGDTVTATYGDDEVFDPTITVGANIAGKEIIHFTNGDAALPVYTKTEVDNLFTAEKKTFDAMHYMGLVSGSAELLAKTNVGNGDVWKANSEFVFNNTDIHVGDLFIAKGTESNGVLTNTVAIWEIVPSGDDQTISATATTDGIKVSDQNGTLAELEVAAGTKIIRTEATTDNKTTVTFAHETITAPTATSGAAVTQADHTSQEFTAITGITEDGYGHVTGYTTKKLTVKDTHNDVTGVELASTSTNNVATTQIVVTTQDSADGVDGEFSIGAATDSMIKVEATGSATTLSLVWGSFDS